MNPQTKVLIQELIRGHRKAIKNSKAKEALRLDPDILDKNSKKFKKETEENLQSLKNYYNELFPIIKSFKKNIKDIIEETPACATYLLLCNMFKTWDAFFELVNLQHHFAALVLIRNIKECSALIELLAIENYNNTDSFLSKWFAGEIINHKECREEIKKFFNNHKKESGPQYPTELATHLYSAESQAPHNSYASILESISPFSEDFEFEGHTANFRTIHVTKYAIGSMTRTNIAIKLATMFVYKDTDTLAAVENVLIKYNPQMESAESNYIIKKFNRQQTT